MGNSKSKGNKSATSPVPSNLSSASGTTSPPPAVLSPKTPNSPISPKSPSSMAPPQTAINLGFKTPRLKDRNIAYEAPATPDEADENTIKILASISESYPMTVFSELLAYIDSARIPIGFVALFTERVDNELSTDELVNGLKKAKIIELDNSRKLLTVIDRKFQSGVRAVLSKDLDKRKERFSSLFELLTVLFGFDWTDDSTHSPSPSLINHLEIACAHAQHLELCLPEAARILSQLCVVSGKRGFHDSAVEYGRRAKMIQEQYFKEKAKTTKDYALSLSALGEAQRGVGDLSSALETHRAASAIFRSQKDSNLPDAKIFYAGHLQLLGNLIVDMGEDVVTGVNMLKESESILKGSSSNPLPLSPRTQSNVINDIYADGTFDSAEVNPTGSTAKGGLKRQSLVGEDLSKLSDALMSLDGNSAIAASLQSIENHKQVEGEASIVYANSLKHHAKLLITSGKSEESKEFLTKAKNIYEVEYGADSKQVKEVETIFATLLS